MPGLLKQWQKSEHYCPGLHVHPSIASGHYSVYTREQGQRKLLFSRDNLLLYAWGWIAAKCIALGDTSFKISGGYIEFENSQTAGSVVVPSYSRQDHLAYYTGLSGNKDYLRLALDSTPTLDQHPDYTTLLPAGAVNRALFGLTGVGGAVGQHGKTFSNANDSVAYGIALVARPLPTDPSQDVILSRGYFAPADQVLVPLGGQVEVDWYLSFK